MRIARTPSEIVSEPLAVGARRVYPSDNHRRNWIDCIRSREQTICPAEVGHRTATICHLANIGYQLRRPLHWHPAAERFVDDDEANALLFREPHSDWSYDVG